MKRSLRHATIGILLLLTLSFSSCFIFRKKNRCDDCPNFHSSARSPVKKPTVKYDFASQKQIPAAINH